MVGGAAAAGLSKVARLSDNQEGGVIGLIYLVGNIVSEGESLLQAVGGAYPPFITEGNVSLILLPEEPKFNAYTAWLFAFSLLLALPSSIR